MTDLLTRWGFKRTLYEKLGIAHTEEAKAIQKTLGLKYQIARETYGHASPQAERAFREYMAIDPHNWPHSR